jgi:LuxR family maltose regulon positive regulatory protein
MSQHVTDVPQRRDLVTIVDTTGLLAEPRAPVRPATRDALVRPRLHEALDRGQDGGLIVVSGPAGAGKTTALTTWAAENPTAARIAWLTLHPFDADPAVFWAALVTAVRQAIGVHDESEGPPPPDPISIARLAGEIRRQPAPLLVVIDNGEYLAGSAGIVSALLCAELPTLRVAFATRYAVPAPLSQLRLFGRLVDVGADELAFTPREAAQLWGLHGRTLTPAEASALVERTGGLAAGVCAPQEILDAGFDDVLDDFLRAEVLAPLPSGLRTFLLRCSLVEVLDAGLAEAVTGRRDAARLLEHLRRERHLLVRCADDPQRLRLRRPFGDFLRREATLQLAADASGVHAAAARWLAEHERPADALRHAVDAALPQLLAGVTVRVAAPLVLGEARDLLLSLPGRLPARDAIGHPETAASLALVAAACDDVHGTAAYADLANQRLAGLPGERRLPVQAALRLGDLMLARQREDPMAIRDTAARLLELLDSAVPGLIPATPALRAIGSECLGTAFFWDGDLDQARVCWENAAAHGRQHGLDLACAAALDGLAVLHGLRGDIGHAAQLAYAHRPVAGDVPPAYELLGRLARGLVQWLRGASGDALEILGDLGERAHGAVLPSARAGLLLRARILLARDDVAAAHAAVTAAAGPPAPSLLDDWRDVTAGEVHLRAGHPAKALAMVQRATRPAGTPLGCHAGIVAARAQLAGGDLAAATHLLEEVHRVSSDAGPWAQVCAWITEGRLADRLGHDGAVRIAIGTALVIADVDGLVAPFVEAGGEAAALLDRNRDLVADYPLLAMRLQAALPATAGAPAPADRLLEALTDRELAILRYLPSLLTVRDIAAELSISQNTVKTHLRGIYRKLAVGTRRDAVGRARHLGLL